VDFSGAQGRPCRRLSTSIKTRACQVTGTGKTKSGMTRQ
jgi:hypothetical protein